MFILRCIFGSLNAMFYLAIAIALVFSPPSSAHAASGMHENHHAMTVSADIEKDMHSHKSAVGTSLHDCGAVSGDSQNETGKCCSGICFSVVLENHSTALTKQAIGGRYVVLDAQTKSIEPSGFLRPPQRLI